MWKRDDLVIFNSGRGFGGDHRVYDGLFGGLDGRSEDCIDGIVREHLQVHNLLAAIGVRIGSGKRDKDIA